MVCSFGYIVQELGSFDSFHKLWGFACANKISTSNQSLPKSMISNHDFQFMSKHLLIKYVSSDTAEDSPFICAKIYTITFL